MKFFDGGGLTMKIWWLWDLWEFRAWCVGLAWSLGKMSAELSIWLGGSFATPRTLGAWNF